MSKPSAAMPRRTFLARAVGGAAAAGLAGAVSGCGPAGASAPSAPRSPRSRTTPVTPPNLLFLFTDEQRCDTLAAYGNRRIETPNLDRLARRSTVFDRAYVTQPVCTPSRAGILMGRPVPHRLQGVSRRAMVEGRSAGPTGDVFIEWNGPNSGVAASVIRRVELPGSPAGKVGAKAAAEAVTDPVRSIATADGWKFNCSPRGDHELYDLNRDPIEVQNLAFVPEMQPMLAELLGRLRAWQQRTGDEVDLPEPPYRR